MPALLNSMVACASLFLATFIHEDVALLAGRRLDRIRRLPWWAVAVATYTGIVTGDLLLYFVGRTAKRIRFLKRLMIGRNVDLVQSWLDEHLVVVIAVCGVVPGVLFALSNVRRTPAR